MAEDMLGPGSVRVTILGGGGIGVGMAAAITGAGGWVDLAEPDPGKRAEVREAVAAQYPDMRTAGYPCGPSRDLLSRLRVVENLDDVSPAPSLVVEAASEKLELKRRLFSILLRWAGDGIPLATTSSAITVSEIVEHPSERAWCLNAHCFNPPAIIRAIECVPAPGTLPQAMDYAIRILGIVGFQAVRLHRAIPAFVGNRLQGAVLREAYRLVDAGVVDVKELDRLVTETLGPRWALSGPFETAELNTPGGIRGHAERMGPAYRAIGESVGEREAGWSDELVERVAAERRSLLPEAEIPARAAWRRKALARLIAARRSILENKPEPENR